MRKKLPLLFTVLIAFASITTAQKNELYLNLNSGMFHYTGENRSYLIAETLEPFPASTGYVTPGNKAGFGIEFSVTGQRVTKSRIIYAVDLAYQSLETRTGKFDVIVNPLSSFFAPSNMDASIRRQFLAISPMLGYRLIDKKFRLDLKAGVEFGVPVGGKQKFKSVIIGNGQELNYEDKLKTKRPDNRIRFQLVGSYKRFALNAGYSVGITRYYPSEMEHKKEIFSRLLRLGVGFRLL